MKRIDSQKKTIRTFFIIMLMVFISFTETFAQNYKTGLGLRLGSFNGVTVKHFLNSENAIEGLLSTRWDGFVITGLYEYQNSLGIDEAPTFDWFIGGGAHIGFWDVDKYPDKYDPDFNDGTPIIGLDFIIGLEYTFLEAPFSLSLDWKPGFNIFGYSHWWGDGAAFSARYTFK